MIRPLAAVLIFVFAATFYSFSSRSVPLSSHGESREALVVQNMVQQQNFILPLRNGSDIPSKPPLFHWLAYTTSLVTGSVDEFSVRLPSACAAAGILVLLWLWGKKEESVEVAALSVMMTATAFEFLRTATLARVDLVFGFFLTLGSICLFQSLEYWRKNERLPWRWGLVTILALAMGTLTKGPAGIGIPGLIAAAYYFSIRPRPRLPLSLGVFIFFGSVLLAAFWYLAAYEVGGARFFDTQLMRENLARVIGSEDYELGHSSPFFMSPVLFFVGFFPWSFFLPVSAAVLWRERHTFRNHNAARYALIWLVVYLVFYAFTTSKRIVYLLPAFPPAALLIALGFSRWKTTRRDFRKCIISSASLIALSSGLIFTTLVLALLFPEKIVGQLRPRDQLQVIAAVGLVRAHWGVLILIGTGSLALLLAAFHIWKEKLITASLEIAVVVAVLAFTISNVLLPNIADFNSPKRFVQSLKPLLDPKIPIYQIPYGREFFAAAFYLNRNVPVVANAKELNKTAYLLIAEPEALRIVSQLTNFRVLATSEEHAAYGRAKLSLVSIEK